MANDIIDINVYETVETVAITVNPNLTTVNINKVTGGSGSFTNLSTTQTASNFTINSDTGDSALVPLGNGTLAGATLNDYTTAEKNKLSGIATGAEVNVNADWNATSGDAQILNKPTIPAASPITIVNDSSLFSTGLTGTGDGATDANNSNFFGDSAGYNATNANYSNFIGFQAGYQVTGVEGEEFRSNFIGYEAGRDATNANDSNFFGFLAGQLAINANNSNFIGRYAGSGATSANYSNFIGVEAGQGASNANYSNFIGFQAGYEATDANHSNLLGYNAGSSFADNNIGSNNIIIGTNISLPDATANSLNIGGILFGTGTYSDIVSDTPSITPTSEGKIGIGVVEPTSTLHIYSEAANTSGLRLERLTSASPTTAGQAIGVDASGNIVTVTGGGGGGSSVNYYLNGGTSQGTFGGTTYYEFSKTAVIGTGADFNISSNGYIASFITDVADPSLLLIPAGNWNLEFFFSSSSAGGSPSFYVELYKYDGTTFTLIASNSTNPEGITNGTSIDAYFTPLSVPETVLTVNDRLAIRVFVNASSKTITLHTQNGHLCEVITTFTAGLTALNGLQAQVQNFATGTTGTDFAINSSGSTHTFNLPSASATARGVVTTASQTFAGAKTFSSNPKIPINPGNIGAGGIVIDDGTGQIEVANNLIYPNTNELTYVKGVTSGIQSQFSGKVSTNTAITGATKTKITYDAKGLVTAGADIATTDISDFNSATRGQVEAELVAGTNITITPSGTGATRQLTIASTGGGSSSQAAYTILANNTNASAVPTEQVYKDVAQQSLSGTGMIATGGTLPSGTQTHFYRWSQVGNLVTVRINLQFGTAGTCSGIAIPFANMPDIPQIPQHPSIYATALDVITYGTGMLNIVKPFPLFTSAGGMSGIRIKTIGTPNTYEFLVGRTSSSYNNGWIHIQYYI